MTTSSNVIKTDRASETAALGRRLGESCRGGEVIALTGELGSGKTVFIKGLAKGLGVSQPVTSPTFTISRLYQGGRLPFYHFDLYRVESHDMARLELAEAASGTDSVVAVEWADRDKAALPAEYLDVRLEAPSPEQRHILLLPRGRRYEDLLGMIKPGDTR